MLAKFRPRLTYANVVSTICLCLVVGGGSAYAANTVGSSDVIDESLLSQDIKNGEVKTPELANGAVGQGKLAANSVVTGKVVDDSLGAADLGPNSVGTSEVADGAITSAKVLDDTAGGGLAAADLAANSVGTSEIQTNGVGAGEVATNAIDSDEIVDFSLTNEDVGVLFAEVAPDGTLSNSSGGVTATKLPTPIIGQYEVDFGRNLSTCTAVATLGPAGTGESTGEINVADRDGNIEAVIVRTKNSGGGASGRAFRLVVVC